jgi:nucleoside 2-deoxyribosyltransferase
MGLAARRSKEPGSDFLIEFRDDYPLADCGSFKSLQFLVQHACDADFVKSTGSSQYQVTFGGWQYIERTGLSSQAPASVFVAMSFDDAMDPAYLEGIKPAVEQDCGFVCVNLKHKIHNDDITDRMLAEIRRCQILVADFTQQKHGVYYEAGFALALGKEVIWCVRKDEMNKVHFDTNHRAHITWETPDDLRTRLAAFIQAKFQDAIRQGAKP